MSANTQQLYEQTLVLRSQIGDDSKSPGGRHVQVTAVHGKTMFLMGASVALLGVGTFLTLLLVIFNRHVTLQQINASLAQLSNQMRQLQGGKGPDAVR